jgi:hypothetical protein
MTSILGEGQQLPYIFQAGLELMIILSILSNARIIGMHHHVHPCSYYQPHMLHLKTQCLCLRRCKEAKMIDMERAGDAVREKNGGGKDHVVSLYRLWFLL